MGNEHTRPHGHPTNQLMNTHTDKDKLFYKLVNNQRSAPNKPPSIRVNDRLVTETPELLDAWADHFQELGLPLHDDSDNYYQQVVQDIATINTLLQDTPPTFSYDDVKEAIKKLNRNRAADPQRLMAEHLKFAPPSLISSLVDLFNAMTTHRYVPASLTCGDLITVPKKGKDNLVPGNHRGITITSVLCKTLEHLLMSRVKSVLRQNQHELQFGFSSKLSPGLAALVCTEILCNNYDNKKTTYTSTLDVQKAFDCVWHESVMRKLFLATQDSWHMICTLLRNIVAKVRIGSSRSREIRMEQGVGQGRIPSSDLYRLHLDDVLSSLESSGLGCHIGPFYCGAPTCADDIILLADSPSDLQGQLSLVQQYSKTERYHINPTKTTVSVFTPRSSDTATDLTWSMGDATIQPCDNFTHLGIERYSYSMAPDELIISRIQLARRTTYALMGVGLHGTNGIAPPIAMNMYETYVIPHLMYSLESIIITPSQIRKLEIYHRSTLKSIQGLPDRTAISAVHLLLGTLPIEGILHMNVLLLISRITSQPGSPLHSIGTRQLATKDITSK